MKTLVELNKQGNNPFSGLTSCLMLLSQDPTDGLLNSAWREVKDDKEKREMFFSLLFSLGDVTNRQHNIFHKGKVDSGGLSKRDAFFNIMEWLRKNNFEQFKAFMFAHLFNEFTCFDNLFKNRIVTNPHTATVKKVYNVFADPVYCSNLLTYVIDIINGNNPFDKMLVAKFLTPPRTGIRQGCKSILPQRAKAMLDKENFIAVLSASMNWEIKPEKWGMNFVGYRNWRKDYNLDLESKLFSTGKINEFDRDEFIEWLNRIPAQARFRVKNKVSYADKTSGVFKYPKLRGWYLEWEGYKEAKQEEERKLAEKVRQGTATDDEKVLLKQVAKEAKVTIGATNFSDLFADILSKKIDKLRLEAFVNKVNLPYNSLVIIDDSGSMSGAPFNFATFIASVCLAKNPDDDARNLLGFFSDDCRFFGHIDKVTKAGSNSLLNRRTIVENMLAKPLYDPKLSFYDNYQSIDSFAHAVFKGNGTYPSTIIDKLDNLAKNDPSVIDEIKRYPIWTIISDGDMNDFVTSTASMDSFFTKAETVLGFRPFVILIDINGRSASRSRDFVNIPNFVHIQNDPVQIEQVLTNFKDIDVMDVFTPLQSVYRSSRYAIVRKSVL
jgi:hypothetical protein